MLSYCYRSVDEYAAQLLLHISPSQGLPRQLAPLLVRPQVATASLLCMAWVLVSADLGSSTMRGCWQQMSAHVLHETMLGNLASC